MKVKAVVWLLGVLGICATTVRAQEPSTKFDAFAGYSYVRANPTSLPSFNMNGGEASLAYKANNWLSGVADFAGYRTSRLIFSPPNFKGNMWTYQFGPRVTYRHLGRVTPYVQTLFGVAHATSDTYLLGHNQTDFAMTLGGGIDYRLSHRLSLHLIEADDLVTRFKEFSEAARRPTQNNVRISTGVVFHF